VLWPADATKAWPVKHSANLHSVSHTMLIRSLAKIIRLAKRHPWPAVVAAAHLTAADTTRILGTDNNEETKELRDRLHDVSFSELLLEFVFFLRNFIKFS
jgi:hypothetical protein